MAAPTSFDSGSTIGVFIFGMRGADNFAFGRLTLGSLCVRIFGAVTSDVFAVRVLGRASAIFDQGIATRGLFVTKRLRNEGSFGLSGATRDHTTVDPGSSCNGGIGAPPEPGSSGGGAACSTGDSAGGPRRRNARPTERNLSGRRVIQPPTLSSKERTRAPSPLHRGSGSGAPSVERHSSPWVPRRSTNRSSSPIWVSSSFIFALMFGYFHKEYAIFQIRRGVQDARGSLPSGEQQANDARYSGLALRLGLTVCGRPNATISEPKL